MTAGPHPAIDLFLSRMVEKEEFPGAAYAVGGRDGTVLYVEGGLAAAPTSELVWVDRSGQEAPLDSELGVRRYHRGAFGEDTLRTVGMMIALGVDIRESSPVIWTY